MSTAWEVQFTLERMAGKTLHSSLLEQLISDITSGRLLPGSMLPGTRALAQQLGINRKTVQQVYEELEAQGWLETRSRSGTFVSQSLPEKGLTQSDAALVDTATSAKMPSQLVEGLYHEALSSFQNANSVNDGTPDPRLIPYELLARTYRRVCMGLKQGLELGYGDPRGTHAFRRSVCTMLKSDRFMNCDLDQLCIVRGSQMGIYLTSKVLDPQAGAIVMEELSYLPAKAAFQSNGFEVIDCRLDENGLDIDHLRDILRRQPIAGIYLTPHHQYPTTVCLPMDRRLELLDLSRKFGFALIEDDYDHEFHYAANPIPPLASLPNSENVVHIGSMSKVFSPGLRLGYVAASAPFIERIAQEIIVIDRQGNTLGELVLSDLMESGEVKRHIRKTRKLYKARRDFAVAEFRRVLGDQVSFTTPSGGLAIWVDISKLSHGLSSVEFGSRDLTLNTFYTSDETQPTHVRFGFGGINEQEITRAIEGLSEAIHRIGAQANKA